MLIKKKFICLACLIFIITNIIANPLYKSGNLKCEYLVNPIGIDAKAPRLSWKLMDERRGAKQTAYQLYVGTDSANMLNGIQWQTGKINSGTQMIIYNGKPLQAFTRYYWRVDAWDKDGKKYNPGEMAFFETGMMQMGNWQGSWISDVDDIHLKPAPAFRNVFNTAKKVQSARAYIAVAGLYELYLNGQKIGNHQLDPMYTRFDRRTLYVTYDVTQQLQAGKNAIGVLLGNGWYNHQSTAVWDFHKAPWRTRPSFCLDLRITYNDGSTETITSGKNWTTSLSPVIFNSIYTAEHYDARLEQPGWNTVNFDDSKWKPVIHRSAPSKNIVAQVLYQIEHVEKIPVASLNKISDSIFVFDLGRNISGVSEIKLSGQAGTIIRLKHAEQLNTDGRVDQSNIDIHYRPMDNADPFQTDIFILSGKGNESFIPRFNYKGFQYVEVSSDKPLQLTKESLTGYFMHSNVPSVGRIGTSNTTIDKIWKATNNSYLSNLFGYPTDCPQREKNGWTGDAHIASETGLYNFDGITIYEKWMADHRDEQQPNGVLPAIIPTGGWGYQWANGPDWTSTIAIIPWNIYLFYGDSKLLADCYDNIKVYVDHINELYPAGLTNWGLGDWVPVKSVSPVELTSSVYYFVDATILAKAAKILGKTSDHEKYAALANKIKNAVNTKYLDKTTGLYGIGLQTELSVPLYWGLVPTALKSKVAANLARRMELDSNHLDVGLLGTKAILNALSENGYADIAYRLASQETFPSWGWWIVNGATTLYENWPIDAKSDISRNHIMFGEIGAWLYKGIGGIKPDENKAGFKHIVLEPHFVKGLNRFDAMHESPYGKIISSWKKTGNSIMYSVSIPANTTATLHLDLSGEKNIYYAGKLLSTNIPFIKYSGKAAVGMTSYKVEAGSYEFEIR